MNPMQMNHPPLSKVKVFDYLPAGMQGQGVRFPNIPHISNIFIIASSILIIPMLFALDAMLFTITRPSCMACATFSGYFADHSMTMIFIQGNNSLKYMLEFFRKII